MMFQCRVFAGNPVSTDENRWYVDTKILVSPQDKVVVIVVMAELKGSMLVHIIPHVK